MVEEMLNCWSGMRLAESCSEPQLAELDEDGRRFYAAMAADIAAAAPPSRVRRTVRLLRAALAAPAVSRTGSWRQFYREIGGIVAESSPAYVGEGLRDVSAAARERLGAFLLENIDLAAPFGAAASAPVQRPAFRAPGLAAGAPSAPPARHPRASLDHGPRPHRAAPSLA